MFHDDALKRRVAAVSLRAIRSGAKIVYHGETTRDMESSLEEIEFRALGQPRRRAPIALGGPAYAQRARGGDRRLAGDTRADTRRLRRAVVGETGRKRVRRDRDGTARLRGVYGLTGDPRDRTDAPRYRRVPADRIALVRSPPALERDDHHAQPDASERAVTATRVARGRRGGTDGFPRVQRTDALRRSGTDPGGRTDVRGRLLPEPRRCPRSRSSDGDSRTSSRPTGRASGSRTRRCHSR